MHEKILQGVTVGIVAGLIVYWLTSEKHEGWMSSHPTQYRPLLGDVRAVGTGRGTDACCACCGLPAPENNSVPLASDFLCGAPPYGPSVSDWNAPPPPEILIDNGVVYREETASSFAYGITGPRSTPRPIAVKGVISCAPDVPVSVCNTEII